MTSEKKPLRKILYVAMHFEYGKQEWGPSFEYNNFYRVLERMFPDIVEFDFMTILKADGKEAMNTKLLAMAEQVKPDLIIFFLFTDEFSIETLNALKAKYTTYNWFADDHWRFDTFSGKYAPSFSFVSTTDIHSLPKYEKIGYRNALLTQWGCNHFDYVRMPDLPKKYDVSFIGQPHGTRKWIVKRLGWAGIKVETFGAGWPNGRVTQQQMIEVMNSSKINLNLSNSSWNIHTIFRNRDQIKGRNFEIPGTGSFLLTNYVDGLERYYDLKNEMICFRSTGEMIRLIRYYLQHDEEREAIARRAYERILREHTYEQRFRTLFDQMGFTVETGR